VGSSDEHGALSMANVFTDLQRTHVPVSSKLLHALAGDEADEGIIFIEGDPGLPEGVTDDPFAGLDEATASSLRAVLDERETPDDVWPRSGVQQRTVEKRPGTAKDVAFLAAVWRRYGSAWITKIKAQMGAEYSALMARNKKRQRFFSPANFLGFFEGTVSPADWRAFLEPGMSLYPINAAMCAKRVKVKVASQDFTITFSGDAQKQKDEPFEWVGSALRFVVRWQLDADEWDALQPTDMYEERLRRRPLAEGKAVGSASHHGAIAMRDIMVRHQGAFPTTHRSRIKMASSNALRDIKPIQEVAKRRLLNLIGGWWSGGRGAPDYHKVRVESTKILTTAYEQMREVGRRASGIDRHGPGVDPRLVREEEDWFRGAVREELRYWNVFMEEIHNETASKRARVFERIGNYVDAMRFMYESARILGLPDNVLIYWQGPGPVEAAGHRGQVNPADPHPGDICEGCDYLMERSPFTKTTIPAVPKDGMTACLTNCRHKLVVRVVTNESDMRGRIAKLPSRTTMIRELNKLKEEKHGTWRKERARALHGQHTNHAHPELKRVANPFKGKLAPPKAR